MHCAGQGAEDIRFSVVKKGEPFQAAAMAAAAPVTPGLPADVLSIGESAQVWYCRIGGQTIGPVTAAEIRGAFGKGQIDGQAAVGIQGKRDWFPIRALPQFSDLLTGIGPAPTSRPLREPVPVAAHSAPLPGRQSAPPRRPMNLPPLAQPATSLAPGPLSTSTPAMGAVAPITSPDRDDKTEVVPPLPPPGEIPGVQYVTPVPSRNLPPPPAVLLDEVRRLKRVAVILGVLAGVLFITTAALLGLLAAG